MSLGLFLNPRMLLGFVQVALFVLLFEPTWGWMAERFRASDSFYGHGWLVPLAVGYLVRRRWSALRTCTVLPNQAGLGALLLAVLVHLAAWRLRIGFVSGFAMIGVLVALVWVNLGREALRVLRLPLAFLVFMVPLPGIVLIGASFGMKLWAATWATQIINALGIAAVQAGSMIRLDNNLTIIVDDVCGGLRSLIALMALSVLWGERLPATAGRFPRLALFVASIPIALLTNMVRIIVMTLVAVIYGVKAAEGFIHFAAGILVFGLAMVILAALERLLTPRAPGPQ